VKHDLLLGISPNLIISGHRVATGKPLKTVPTFAEIKWS
jgi:hypothetical protein